MTATAFGAGDIVLQNLVPLTQDVPLSLSPGTIKVVCLGYKIDSTLEASCNARAYDVCGSFSATIDPVSTVLEIDDSGEAQQTFTGISSADRYVIVQNGAPGLTWLNIVVNGNVYALSPLTNGQSLTLDVGAVMNPGDDNTVILVGGGVAGASATIIMADTVDGDPMAASDTVATQAVQLQINRTGQGMQLSWPEAGMGLVLQSRSSLGVLDTWANWPDAPQLINGNFVLTVPLTNTAQLFRLH
jgi:hypothetical protein